jgi:hypothetical protein
MSRTNPNKRKPRRTRATAQIVVEGFTEEAFCRHLRSLYARDCGISVDIHNARGGSPKDIVRSALKRKGFDRTFIMYDTDLPLSQSWAAKSRAAGHIIVASTPCVEALFLSILEEPVPARTEDCKRAFSKHLTEQQKCDYRAYPSVFSRELLTACPHPAMVLLRSVFDRKAT